MKFYYFDVSNNGYFDKYRRIFVDLDCAVDYYNKLVKKGIYPVLKDIKLRRIHEK